MCSYTVSFNLYFLSTLNKDLHYRSEITGRKITGQLFNRPITVARKEVSIAARDACMMLPKLCTQFYGISGIGGAGRPQLLIFERRN